MAKLGHTYCSHGSKQEILIESSDCGSKQEILIESSDCGSKQMVVDSPAQLVQAFLNDVGRSFGSIVTAVRPDCENGNGTIAEQAILQQKPIRVQSADTPVMDLPTMDNLPEKLAMDWVPAPIMMATQIVGAVTPKMAPKAALIETKTLVEPEIVESAPKPLGADPKTWSSVPVATKSWAKRDGLPAKSSVCKVCMAGAPISSAPMASESELVGNWKLIYTTMPGADLSEDYTVQVRGGRGCSVFKTQIKGTKVSGNIRAKGDGVFAIKALGMEIGTVKFQRTSPKQIKITSLDEAHPYVWVMEQTK